MLLLAPLICALVACGAAAPSAYEMPPSDLETQQAELHPALQPPSSAPAVGGQANPTPASNFILLYTPAPTETTVPPLELPPLEAGAPPALTWDGRPTYLAESQPGYFFRVQYDPEIWAQTRDISGIAALGHRSIAYCLIAPSSGRGLPLNAVVEHETRKLGVITYEVNTVFASGQVQLVTYVGGDGLIVTGFEVVFQEDVETCLSDAEVVLGSLQSISQLQATIVP
jgi:hypothetical protein